MKKQSQLVSSLTEWFEVIKSRPYLYTIRERLDRLDTRFYTTYTNLYLIVGSHSAILFDTGSGVGNIKELVKRLIGNTNLYVLNSHNHFDHVAGNGQFEETYIHRMDFKKLVNTMDVEFLKGGNEEFRAHFEALDWKLTFAEEMVPLIGNEVYDLGGVEVELMYTPGHTPGSVCLFINTGEVLTGDTIHYGAVFLPSKDNMLFYSESLRELRQKIMSFETPRLFPGHEKVDIEVEIFDEFEDALETTLTMKPEFNRFLEAKVYQLEKFTIIEPMDPTDPDQLLE